LAYLLIMLNFYFQSAHKHDESSEENNLKYKNKYFSIWVRLSYFDSLFCIDDCLKHEKQ
jgi:hypothetical protein